MNTYDKNSGNARNNDPVNGHEEEIFLSGGFDSFSQDNTSFGSTDNLLGTASSDYENTYYGNTNTGSNFWEQKHYLGFWEQLFNSFRPTRYDRYKGISIEAAKHFVRNLSLLYMGTGFILIIGFIFGNTDMRTYLQYYNLLSPINIVYFLACCVIAAFIYPFIFRLGALIMRLVGRLIAMILGKDITSENMYLISIYSLVPWLFIKMLLGIFFISVIDNTFVTFGNSLNTVSSLLDAIVPTIIMSIAISHMEN